MKQKVKNFSNIFNDKIETLKVEIRTKKNANVYETKKVYIKVF